MEHILLHLPRCLPVEGTEDVSAPASDSEDSRCAASMLRNSETATPPHKCLLRRSRFGHPATVGSLTLPHLPHPASHLQLLPKQPASPVHWTALPFCFPLLRDQHPLSPNSQHLDYHSFLRFVSFFSPESINLILVTPSWSKMLCLYIVLPSYCSCNKLPQSSCLKQHQ